ncbi:MAG: ATP-binding protein [Microscillaceae bacterium]|nr:ATP-binding protein [Microscillaceae bacterium]MDW8461919.1 ATP-binding protein [Cytophagales bacterium]
MPYHLFYFQMPKSLFNSSPKINWIRVACFLFISLQFQDIFAQSPTSTFSLIYLDSLKKQFAKDHSITVLTNMINYLNYFVSQGAVEINDVEQNLQEIHEIVNTGNKYKTLKPLIFQGMGYLAAHKGKKELAVQYFEEGASYYESNQKTHELADFFLQIGIFFYNTEQLQDALAYLKRARNALKVEELNSPIHRNILNTEGLTYKKLKSYERAEQAFYKALQISTKLKDTTWIGLVSGNLAVVYVAKGNLNEALKLLRTDVTYSLKGKLYMSASNALAEMGKIFLSQRAYPQAENALDSALFIINQFGQGELITNTLKGKKNIFQLLSKLKEQQKDYQQALSYKKRFIEVSDSLNNLNKHKELEILMGHYQYQDAQKELQVLIKENTLKQTYIYFSFIVWVVVIITVAILLNKNRLLKEKQRQIETQKAYLEKMNFTKTMLLSVISHDFRSPLAAIKSLIGLLQDNAISPQEATNYYPYITEKIDDTLNFLESLLTWTKGQMDGMKLNPTWIDLHLLTLETIKFLQQSLQNKKITINNRLKAPLQVYADEATLKIIIRNLLNNAIKYSYENTTITIDYEILNQDFVKISIQDQGIGMKPETLSKLFTQNLQSVEGTAQEKGSGWGLIFCKDFVEKNGGEINVISEPGKGSTFYFTIPLKPLTLKSATT